MYVDGNLIRLSGAYALSIQKIYFRMLKKYGNFFLHLHIQNLSVFVKFRRKPIISWYM
jgi:hypothetical protein